MCLRQLRVDRKGDYVQKKLYTCRCEKYSWRYLLFV